MTNTNTKLTKRVAFTDAMHHYEEVGNQDMVQFFAHEIELLDKKNGAPRKPTAQQLKYEEVKGAILEILTKPMTATQVMKAVEPKFPDLSITNQRVSYLLRTLGASGSGDVERTMKGKTAYFQRVKA